MAGEPLAVVDLDDRVGAKALLGTGALTDGEYRAVLVRGLGRPGADQPDLLQSVITAARSVPLPFVAAVQGPCAGLSVLAVVACDLVIACREATFTLPPGTLDVALGNGLGAMLVDRIGFGRASQLSLLADTIDSSAALTWGLVTEVVNTDEADPTARALAGRLAAGPTIALGSIKIALNALGRDAAAHDVTAGIRSSAHV